MSDSANGRLADELARELDLLVYRLERPAPTDPAELTRAWQDLRRALERLRERAEDLAQRL
jgi:hypothetical protein